MNQSKLFSLNWKDGLKAILMAALGAAIMVLYTAIEPGGQGLNEYTWKEAALAALSAGLGYIIKNWLTNSKNEFGKKE